MMSIVTSMKACKQFHFGSVIWIFVAIFGTYYVSVRYTNIKYAKRLVEHQMKEQAQKLQNADDLQNDKKVILFWTSFYKSQDFYVGFGDEGFQECPVSNCQTTNKKELLHKSDAVIFHPFNINLKMLPPLRFPHQRWIFFHGESPLESSHVIEQVPDIFNWTMTYRTDSDIVKMYSDGLGTWPSDQEEMELRAKLKEKNKFAVWFVSHCKTYSKREDYVKQLKEFVDVDVIGLCGRKKCPKRHKKKCLNMLTYQYKFYLAFENSLCRDYVTEKFYNALAHYIVPVVYGGVDYAQFAPKGSYIDVRDYKSPEHLAEYLLYLDSNQTAYEKYFEWRKVYQPKRTSAWCQLCEMLNNPTLPSQSYKNIYNWWFEQGQCDHDASTKTSRPDVSFIWRKRATHGRDDQVDLDLLNDEYDSEGLNESRDLLTGDSMSSLG